MKLTCNKANPPLGGVIAAEYAKLLKKIPLEIQWGDETVVEDAAKKVVYETNNDLLRAIARLFAEKELYGTTSIEKTEVDHWLTVSIGSLSSKTEFNEALTLLNNSLGPVTFLANKRLTIADFAIFSTLYASKQWQGLVSKKEAPVNVIRWYNFLKTQPAVANVLNSLPKDVTAALTATNSRQSAEKTSNVGNRAREGKFVELPGAEMGKVVVRFPPEASGFLHIGHAKAALLNQYYQEAFQGKLIMRFDDTNPAKENVHFEKVILEDVAMLEIKPDMFTHTSQYFDLMLDYCEKLLKENKAYVDDTDPETMKTQREQKVESANRTNTYEQNLKLWEEMKKGTDKGQKCCVRAKIDMQSPNGCLRDPTIYRCKNEPHPRTGTQYKVYPTYDFACPIVDAIEGVTHTLRTMEYHDRDPQFYWFIEALGLRKPYIWEYSRLSMTNTVLSKRKLTWFVNEGLVDGWDDPRMPTVRGVLRRGMTVQGLKEFIIAQGSSRSVVFMEWDKIWAFNKKVIDPIAPRFTALEHGQSVVVHVKGVKEECLTVPKHPKNNDVGNKSVWIGPEIIIDRVDAECLKEGENATFINWGNLLIKKINREKGVISSIEAEPNLDNKDYKKTLKLTWLAVTDQAKFTPTWCVYFDHIISKPLLGKDEDFKEFINHDTRKEVQMIGDPELRNLRKGDIIQLQRRGFFRVDVPYGPLNLHTCKDQPIILFYIPDGHTTKENVSSAVPTKQPAVTSEKSKIETVKKTLSVTATKIAATINSEIIKQGDLVRNLKSQKAPKDEIDAAVETLLSCKTAYKNLTNIDWKPGCVPPTSSTSYDDPSTKVAAQGDKSEKSKIEPVKETSISSVKTAVEINSEIVKQGDIVRNLKSQKVPKDRIDAAVKTLLALKTEYKNLTNIDWKPGCVPPDASTSTSAPAAANSGSTDDDLSAKIAAQGDKVRKLKAAKAGKDQIDQEVKNLLSLKADFKKITGKDWTPADMKSETKTTPPPVSNETITKDSSAGTEALVAKVNEQGNLVRDLKSKKASKEEIDKAVKVLLELKTEYKNVTGTDFPVAGRAPTKPKEPQAKQAKIKAPPKEKPTSTEKNATDVEEGGLKKQTRLGLEVKKEENLSEWYSQVITKADMIEYSDISGCYGILPWSFAVWKAIKAWFEVEIAKLGVKECYFPIFISKSALEKEKTHIADFSPEVAWVTKAGDSELAEHIAIRPTSETGLYPAFARRLQSYKNLPIKWNQWNNVVRWEFKHPQPFLRTREFLWQEGHTAYAVKADAEAEVKTILDLYAGIYTDLLAIPVVKGRKTEKEKFAGGDYTLTVEAFVSASGRAIQGATSHHLGQNFSKMFEIVYEDPVTHEKEYVYQNSWGITTRTIGVMIMVHADNQGLVLPPRVADVQIVVIPCGITAKLTESGRNQLQKSCDDLETKLRQAGVKVEGDYRDDYSPGWKFNHWELKGVPIRVELGPKDIEKNQIVAVRRDTGEKITLERSNAVGKLKELLDDIHNNLLQKATNDLNSHKVLLKEWAQFPSNLDAKNIILAPFCGDSSCEDKIKQDSAREDSEPGAPSMGAKSLCIPLEQPAPIEKSDKCIHPDCKRKPLFYTLFGRSY